MVSFQPEFTFTDCLGFRIRNPGGLGSQDALSSRSLVCGIAQWIGQNVAPYVVTADPVRAIVKIHCVKVLPR